ncbi:MAG: 30S ribosomal protein S6 [Desulfocapsaceae bacterium]
MRRYEQVCILRPSLSEDEINRVLDNTAQLIQDDEGSIIFLNKWGMRKLAYPIKKEMQGYYVLCDFAASSAVVSEIERKFRIDDAVLKYLTVKVSDAISVEEIEAARSEAEAKAIVTEPEEEATDSREEKTRKPAPESAAAPAKETDEAPTKEVSAESTETVETADTADAEKKSDGEDKETEEKAK